MILFADVYKKAINLFDDPKITYAYEHNRIVFDKYMYGYLQTVSISEPVIIGQMLADIIPPDGKMETFESDGTTTLFHYTINVPEQADIICMANNRVVDATIDTVNKTVKFPEPIESGKFYSFEAYFPGAYKANIDAITRDVLVAADILTKVTNILARLIVIAWAEETRSMLVDIQGLLKDSDFKLTPNSQILSAKVNFVKELEYRNDYDQNKLAWQIRYSSGVARFKRF